MTLELTPFTVEIGTRLLALHTGQIPNTVSYRDDLIRLAVTLHEHPTMHKVVVKATAVILVAGTSPGEACRELRYAVDSGSGEFLSDTNMRALVQEAWAGALVRYRHDFKHAEDQLRRFREYDEKFTKIMGLGGGKL